MNTKKRTDEQKKHQSEMLKGRKKPPRSEEHKRKLSEVAKTRVFSKETREKLSRALIGNKRGLGYKHTEDAKRKIGLNGFHYGMKGKKHTEETKNKISMSNKGEKHHNWLGGRSLEEYGKDWTDDLKDSIRKRDIYICQLCGIHQEELDRSLDVHHIDYDKYNLNPENLIALCRNCHTKTSFNREYWSEYFHATHYP